MTFGPRLLNFATTEISPDNILVLVVSMLDIRNVNTRHHHLPHHHQEAYTIRLVSSYLARCGNHTITDESFIKLL